MGAKNRYDAEEIVDDVFALLYIKWNSLESHAESVVLKWLNITLRNVTYSYVRRKNKQARMLAEAEREASILRAEKKSACSDEEYNKLLEKFYAEMISSEDRRRELSRRLEKECKKPVGEADDDAILSLAEEIDSLVPPEQKFTEAELEKKLADVKLKGNRFIESSTRAQAASRSRAPMSIKWKITIVLVAVFVIIMSVATCADLSDKEAKDRISSIMTANITVTPSFNRCKSYKNIEDLVEEKQISILYPSTLPNGEKLTLATYSKENNSDNYDVILTYKKYIYGYYIKTRMEYGDDKPFPGDMNVCVNGIDINLWTISDGSCQAYWHYNGYEYYMGCTSPEIMMELLEGLCEIGPSN